MYKIKKKTPKAEKPPALYNIVEDYTEFDAPGNVSVCAMTEREDVAWHARVLAESYDIPAEEMVRLLTEGGVHVYAESGPLVTRGLFACKVDESGMAPKQTWALDITQYGEAEQLARSYGFTVLDAAERVFRRTLPEELTERLQQRNLGLDYSKLEAHVARGGDSRGYFGRSELKALEKAAGRVEKDFGLPERENCRERWRNNYESITV